MAPKKKTAPEEKTPEKAVPRKRDENYTIVSLLVPRGWSEKMSSIAREHGYTKTSLIQRAVEQYLEGTKEVNFQGELSDINRKLDSIFTILMELVKGTK